IKEQCAPEGGKDNAEIGEGGDNRGLGDRKAADDAKLCPSAKEGDQHEFPDVLRLDWGPDEGQGAASKDGAKERSIDQRGINRLLRADLAGQKRTAGIRDSAKQRQDRIPVEILGPGPNDD